MTTIAIQSKNIAHPYATPHYNKSAIFSLVFSLLFVSYFFVPHTGVLYDIFDVSILFVVFFPLAAFISAIIALRQINRTHDRGLSLGYISLGITSLYFMIALAIPMVLLGAYLLYTYVL